MEIITQKQYQPMPKLEDISEASFRSYANSKVQQNELRGMVIKPFRDAIYESIPWNDENRPEDPITEAVEISDKISFDVTVKPTYKRPAYARIINEVSNTLSQRSEDYNEGRKVAGVLTINDEGYIRVKDVLDQTLELMSKYREGREGVSRRVSACAPEKLLNEVPKSLTVVIGQGYDMLTQQNAQTYLKAQNLIRASESNSKEYEEMLLNETLQQLGLNRPKQVVSVLYAYDDLAFEHQIEPRQTPKHKAVIDALIKAVPERITKLSKAGDLALAVRLLNDDNTDFFRTKGLIDDNWLNDYRPRVREDQVYVRLEGLMSRLHRYRTEFVTQGLEQNIKVVLQDIKKR